ncbi:MAG: GSCFA domain-containing protein [Janthinobacterium lividum]
MFRTELTIAPQERQLARTARVLTVGSCFADSIGERLRLNKVNALVNPFGTVFHPLALAQLLRSVAGEDQDWQQHVVEARGRWQSYDFHSTIGAESPVELLQTIKETVRRVGDFVRTADAVVLTLGTAWAYRLRETGELVSNLHKLPAAFFEKELLTADEIVNSLAEVHALLRRLNPAIRIVLTVSPVRHIKDTLPLNAVSKSVLRVACHYLSELLPGVSYFPAYELLTDELRDYRFYASDMLHPSEVAEDYIWDKFARAYFDADFGRFRKEWSAVRQALGHRPLHLGAPEHRTFLDQTAERLERLSSQGVDVRQELRDVQRQLVALPPPKVVRVPEEALDDEERIDIGDDTATSLVKETTMTTRSEAATQQPERRNGRHDNRRDGRRGDRNGQDRRQNQPSSAPAEPIETEESVAQPLLTLEATADEAVDLVEGSEELTSTADASTAYPAKKKKRRSRGGAKRTARKHAARLATEQEDGLATEELTEELTQETGELVPTAELAEEVSLEEGPVAFTDLDETEDAPAAIEGDMPATAPMPNAQRKRGTGPTPKKSKVITKSGLVKRGERRGLYRAAPPVEATAPVEEPLVQAPIISPPFIPEILLERPAVAEAIGPVLTEPEVTAVDAPEPATAVEATPAAKSRRGRPKAAASVLTATVEKEATTTEPAQQPTAQETPIPPAAPKKAPARTAKPTAPKAAKKPAAKKTSLKKPVAKTAAPRRARPASGAEPTPPGDSPAT